MGYIERETDKYLAGIDEAEREYETLYRDNKESIMEAISEAFELAKERLDADSDEFEDVLHDLVREKTREYDWLHPLDFDYIMELFLETERG